MANSNKFNNAKPIPNKMIQEDGTITDLQGNAVDINTAHTQWLNQVPIPNKMINPDGTISSLPIGGSGDGSGPDMSNYYTKKQIDAMLEHLYPKD